MICFREGEELGVKHYVNTFNFSLRHCCCPRVRPLGALSSALRRWREVLIQASQASSFFPSLCLILIFMRTICHDVTPTPHLKTLTEGCDGSRTRQCRSNRPASFQSPVLQRVHPEPSHVNRELALPSTLLAMGPGDGEAIIASNDKGHPWAGWNLELFPWQHVPWPQSRHIEHTEVKLHDTKTYEHTDS